MGRAKRARTAETPTQPSLCLMLRALHFYPDHESHFFRGAGEQNGRAGGGVDGGKRWDREECGTAKHGPDSVPAKLCPKRTPAYAGPLSAAKRHLLAIRTVCGNSARTDLCGGCPVMGIPTAILDPTAAGRSSPKRPFNVGRNESLQAVRSAARSSLS